MQTLQEQLSALKTELAAIKEKTKNGFNINKNGLVSVRGINSYPISIHGNGWLKLLSQVEALKEYLEENKERIKWDKPNKLVQSQEDLEDVQAA